MMRPGGLSVGPAPHPRAPLPPPTGASPSNLLTASLLSGPRTLEQLHADHPASWTDLYVGLQELWGARAIVLMNKPHDPDVSLMASLTGEALELEVLAPDTRWKLSRFAYARLGDDESFTLSSPRSCSQLTVHGPSVAALLVHLTKAITAKELIARCAWLEDETGALDLLTILRMASIVDCCDADGNTAESRTEELMSWEFHDLLFHHQTRMGRHSSMMGATYRLKGKIANAPYLKADHSRHEAIPLYQPPAEAFWSDPPFSYVLESRRSCREHDDLAPITSQAVGEFLFRSARNRFHLEIDSDTFISRPYPSGGASYELELYLTINRCDGLKRGFYYYNPETHSLSLLSSPDRDMEGLLDDAWAACAGACRPQVLITLSSRFRRVAWKYAGMAYATQLKHVGVVYQTMYLVATAMQLAGCALGLGNVSRFSRLARAEYLEEGSIGEFMLGSMGQQRPPNV